jgi:hypothetical protein
MEAIMVSWRPGLARPLPTPQGQLLFAFPMEQTRLAKQFPTIANDKMIL